MNNGLQQNNFSPMGQGQPQQNKRGRKKNFMTDTMGMPEEPILESVSPGIPPPSVNGTLQQGSGAVPQSVNSTMPVGQPQRFQGQGTGWRGLDTNPVANFNAANFNGFNLDRAMSGGDPDSTKDAYARWAAGNPSLRGLTKEQIGEVINQNLDRARAMGLNIQGVQGDKILIDAKEHGLVWTDGVSDAGGANPQWWWNPEIQGVPSKAPATDIYNAYQNQLVAQKPGDDLEALLMALLSQNQELI